jgi:hypothetical protein
LRWVVDTGANVAQTSVAAQQQSADARGHGLGHGEGKALREHLTDDSPLLPGLAERRVVNLGPIGVDGGEPAVALFRAVRDVIINVRKLHPYKLRKRWGRGVAIRLLVEEAPQGSEGEGQGS